MDIIISGTSRGIGYNTALTALRHGRHRIIGISRGDDGVKELNEIATEAKLNSTFHHFEADLSEENYVPALNRMMSVMNFTPKILINNAGALIKKTFIESNKSDFEYIFRNNFWGPFRLIQAILPFMNKGGHIINISSMSGFQGSQKKSELSLYSASKAALANLSENLADELKNLDIKVNTLCLGAVDTKMFRSAFPEIKTAVNSKEMANYIFNFALESHKIMNGKIIPLSLLTP